MKSALKYQRESWKQLGVSDVQFPISQKRLKTIRRDAKGRGRGQVDALVWADVERVCAFAELDNYTYPFYVPLDCCFSLYFAIAPRSANSDFA